METTNEKKAAINSIKRTPFVHIVEDDKNYIACMRTRMETKEADYDVIAKKAKKYDWNLIGLFVEAIVNELTKKSE